MFDPILPESYPARQAQRVQLDRDTRQDLCEALVGAPEPVRASANHVLHCSPFVTEALRRDECLLADLLRVAALQGERAVSMPWPSQVSSVAALKLADEALFMTWLRRWRLREMVRIAWRDLAGWACLEQTLEDLSAFADQAVQLATNYAWRSTAARYGTPRAPNGSAPPLVVVAMGKLGARELNYSSDIDLVFLFPEYGQTDSPAPISNDEFYRRLGQSVIRLLSAVTVDGQVFRVDMRLRPFGDSGPLVCGFSALEDYLAQHGRDWERYAWVKARALTGADHYAELFASTVRPFVFRRYLDFGVFESLRDMKQQIEKQVTRGDLADHIKLGPGGIREVEFIVQAFQLLRGGQDRRLQSPGLLEVLPLLAGGRGLSSGTVEELLGAYRYLRTLENRLQMIADQQTHQLPTDEINRQRLTLAMAATDWSALLTELQRQRGIVQRHFQGLVFGPEQLQSTVSTPVANAIANLWDPQSPLELLCQALKSVGLAESAEVARLLVEFRDSSALRRLDEPGRKRLQLLLPLLLTELRADDDGLAVLRRSLRVLEAIGVRSSYFALLNENPAARGRFVDVCRGGEFLASQIARHPLLLDELIDERIFSEPPDREALFADLRSRVSRVDADDPERLVEAMCQFKNAAVFRVALADLSGSLPLMRVSDRLTDIAELLVEEALRAAWVQMTAQFGVPLCGLDSARRVVQICAVGYGKLGGHELGYASDLDLVFLHDSDGQLQQTDAVRPVDNQVFFLRLAQRIVHILSVHTAAGRLYEVDQRLRPSGKGGMLITRLAAFADYQRSEAWTWEHQALLHARAVAGSQQLCSQFEAVRLDTVSHYVRRDSLRAEVGKMRLRMRREFKPSEAGEFELKHDPGGIADIEFLAQYWTLQHALTHPPVAMYSDTIRQLESLASADLVPQATVDILTQAYRAYRARAHHRFLRAASPKAAATEFLSERNAVTGIWNATFERSV